LIEVITNAEVVGCEGQAGDFRVRVRKNPRFVHEDICVACGLCVEICPVEVRSRDFDSNLKPTKAIYRPFPQSVPAAFLIDHPRTAPCKEACPIEQDVQGYLALVAVGKFREAHALIRRTSALPGVCGRVCYHPCEENCRRVAVDDSLAMVSPPPTTLRFVATKLSYMNVRPSSEACCGSESQPIVCPGWCWPATLM